jgi:SAM-dependent methyltransferase
MLDRRKLSRVPGARTLTAALRRARSSASAGKVADSAIFWEDHYASGGDSGPGSFGRLARHKADTLNGFVRRFDIRTILEFGCGDGNQLALAEYPSYVGLDTSATAIKRCIERFADDPSKSFFWYHPDYFRDRTNALTAELVLSVDVVYHLVEDTVYERYMQNLFNAGESWVAIYAPDRNDPAVDPSVTWRRFTEWIDLNAPGWLLAHHVAAPYPDDSDISVGSTSEFWFYQRKGSGG